MAADLTNVRKAYVDQLIATCHNLVLAYQNGKNLLGLYDASGLSGTFTDNELAAIEAFKHLTAADIGTVTANIQTLISALSDPILGNLRKTVGHVVRGD